MACHSEEEMMKLKHTASAHSIRVHVCIETFRSPEGTTHPKAVMALGPGPHAVMKALTAQMKRLK